MKLIALHLQNVDLRSFYKVTMDHSAHPSIRVYLSEYWMFRGKESKIQRNSVIQRSSILKIYKSKWKKSVSFVKSTLLNIFFYDKCQFIVYKISNLWNNNVISWRLKKYRFPSEINEISFSSDVWYIDKLNDTIFMYENLHITLVLQSEIYRVFLK